VFTLNAEETIGLEASPAVVPHATKWVGTTKTECRAASPGQGP